MRSSFNARKGTVLGFVTGVAAAFAYLVSCSDANVSSSLGGTAGNAGEVDYSNARSGLRATNVQAAIDEIGTTVRTATTTPRTAMRQPRSHMRSAHAEDHATGATTWSVQVSTLDTASESMKTSAGGSISFTETAAGEGSYTTSGANVLMKAGLFGLPADAASTGKYFIVGNSLVVTAQPSAGGAANGFAWRLTVSDGGKVMTLDDGGAFLVLTKS